MSGPLRETGAGRRVAAVSFALVLPVSVERGGRGSTAWIDVHGDTAFTLTGYRLSGRTPEAWNAPCGSATPCLTGYFATFVTDGDFPRRRDRARKHHRPAPPYRNRTSQNAERKAA